MSTELLNPHTDSTIKANWNCLFPVALISTVPIVEIEKRSRTKQVAQQVYKQLQGDSNDRIVLRAANDQIDKCVSCVELIKEEAANHRLSLNWSVLYQWTKIGEIRVQPTNKLALDSYVPVLEILLSKTQFGSEYENESIQELKLEELASSPESSHSTGTFSQPTVSKLEPIGNENSNNIFRRKRKR
ncbi:hypothetical protein M3Y94_00197300 [Aphelenchoides besseyi]|nr:hypothetical protein M3Y94_00197300 [Aphelenchoides besseyi]KAI6236739.1 hypothetical protein M3Y95_00190300 [Aphelenchoides besseyi]